MEENKEKKCCEGKENENCCGGHGHCNWKKCHGMKNLVWIILIIIAFCLGSQLGELKSEARGNHFYRSGMMDWNYKVVKPLVNDTSLNTPVTSTPATVQ